MKPKPLSSLNHLTVPVGMLLGPPCVFSLLPTEETVFNRGRTNATVALLGTCEDEWAHECDRRQPSSPRSAPAQVDADGRFHPGPGALHRGVPAPLRRRGHVQQPVRLALRDGVRPRPGEAGLPGLARP